MTSTSETEQLNELVETTNDQVEEHVESMKKFVQHIRIQKSFVKNAKQPENMTALDTPYMYPDSFFLGQAEIVRPLDQNKT